MPRFRSRSRLSIALVSVIAFVLVLTAYTEARAQPGPEPRIVNGEPVGPGIWPSVAALVLARFASADAGQFCGGNLIAPTWVLTAAHCTDFLQPSQLDLVLGRLDLRTNAGERIRARRIIIHPDWDPATFEWDFALVELSRPSVQPPMALIDPGRAYLVRPGAPAWVAGWGVTTPRAGSPVLLGARVQIIADAVCGSPAQYGAEFFPASMFCAAAPGTDTCQGDSGGPLMVIDPFNRQWLQAGVTSWGIGCARPNNPGVYARILAALDFIRTAIGPSVAACDPQQRLPGPSQLSFPNDVSTSAAVERLCR